MAAPVVVPQAGLEVDEGTVISIYVEAGARVDEGDPLVELETDKAVTDVVAPAAGVVVAIDVEVGQVVPVGGTLVVMEYDDGDVPAEAPGDHPTEAPGGVPAQTRGDDSAEATAAVPVAAGSAPAPPRTRAAPVARRAAQRLGIALEEVTGTGPRGRVTLADVERFAPAPAAERTEPAPVTERIEPAVAGERIEPLSPTRRAIARRMVQSAQIPQFALDREIDATSLREEKRRLAREIGGTATLSVTDLLAQAMAEMLVRHPELAATYGETPDGQAHLRHRDGVDVGLAVATERGLLVAVLRDAHERGLAALAAERGRLVQAARDGTLAGEDMRGATTTLSNLGPFGVDRFAAMLNPGETTILAVGRTVDRVVPRGLAVVPMLTLTLTVDHRAADGAAAAAGLGELAALLEGRMAWRP